MRRFGVRSFPAPAKEETKQPTQQKSLDTFFTKAKVLYYFVPGVAITWLNIVTSVGKGVLKPVKQDR